MNAQTYDAIVVGGGPAGSTCAWKLRQAGLHVLVIDKRDFPRDKPCAGWVTPQVVEALELDLNDYRHQLVLQPITGFACGIIGGQSINVDYERTISYGIRRCEFDHFLLSRSGASVALHEAVQSIDYRDRRWTINGRYVSPLLIGAGGNFCPVARHLGSRRQDRDVVVAAQEVEFIATDPQLASCPVSAERPELYFCSDLEGYGWFFRKQNVLNIGLGRMDSDRISAHVAEFCTFLRDTHRLQFPIPVRFVGHAYRLYAQRIPQLASDGALLIGDAAGLAFAQSGEGIRPATESALLAADLVVRLQRDYSQSRLAEYEQRIRSRFGKPVQPGLIDMLPASWLAGIARRLVVNRWFARHVIMDRWFLHAHQPALGTQP